MAAAIVLLERGREGVTAVLKTAALALVAVSTAAVSAVHSPALVSSAPWWEKVTVTVGADGKPGACSYQTSLQPNKAKTCAVAASASTAGSDEPAAKDQYTRITFERRFSPAAKPDTDVGAGETLLGGQVMALAIDKSGAVKGCRIVAASGDMKPNYGCDEATAERFEASVGAAQEPQRESYMTVLVYGHAEHVV